MYHKIKNTLAGLSIVAAFIVSGFAFSDPVPAEPAPAAMSTGQQEAEFALALVGTAVAIAQQQFGHEAATVRAGAEAAARHARSRAASRMKLQLGMPYYSFGAMLPRRGES